MEHVCREQHIYTGNRKDADLLIAWLMDRGFWLEASQSDAEWTVVCGCSPEVVQSAWKPL